MCLLGVVDWIENFWVCWVVRAGFTSWVYRLKGIRMDLVVLSSLAILSFFFPLGLISGYNEAKEMVDFWVIFGFMGG